jgi:hypothetical protein
MPYWKTESNYDSKAAASSGTKLAQRVKLQLLQPTLLDPASGVQRDISESDRFSDYSFI